MAIPNTRDLLKTELCERNIDTPQEIRTFKLGSRRRGDMLDVLGAVRTQRSDRFVSRKRQRHDALDLIRQGRIFQGCGEPVLSVLTGLSLWFDGDDASTIDAINDGDPIGSQGDKSGNGLDATQTTTSLKPTYEIGERNGRSVVRYEAGDFLSVGNDSLLETNDFSIFVVMQRTASVIDGTFIAVEYQEVSPNLSGYLFHHNLGNLRLEAKRSGGATALQSSGVSFPAGEWSIVTATKVSDAALLYKNGTQIASFPTGFASPIVYDTAPRSTPPPLADTRLGHGVNRFAFRGDLAEVILYDRQVTDQERDDIWDYLAEKWAITL